MNETCPPPWAITPEKVDEAVRRLIEAAHPRQVILFGSYIRGQTHRDSDLDALVVVDDSVADPLQESARLRSRLRGLRLLLDIIVVQESRFNQLRDRIGLIYREAVRHGKVVYAAP